MSSAVPVAAAATAGVSNKVANTDYMARSRRFPARMPLIGGNLNGPYALGATLNFIQGPVNNGWMDAIELDVNIQVTMATATAAVNAGYPWNFVQYITINLDGQISLVEPYFACYIMPRLKRWEGTGINSVLAGVQDTDVQNTLYNVPASTLAIGANTIRFRMFIPLNALHALDGSGLLPTQGTQDPVQVNVVLPSTLIGADPWLYPAASATGVATITGTSTITCYSWIRDGRTNWSTSEQLPFMPDGLPQVSYDREPDVINLVAGSIVRGQLTKVMKMYYGVAVGIDGQQSTNFSLWTNWNSWDISGDSSGNFKLYQFGLENIPMDLLWSKLRNRFGQDWPEGVLPFVYAPQENLWDIDASHGTSVLNMMAGGWTSLYQGVNFAAIGSVAGIQPRLHTCILGTLDSPYVG